MGNIAHRATFKPTNIWSVMSCEPFQNQVSLIQSPYQRLPVYAAPCPIDQCRELQYPRNGSDLDAIFNQEASRGIYNEALVIEHLRAPLKIKRPLVQTTRR